MPRGNRTGPTGMGPLTGRAAGFCAGKGEPAFAGLGAGLGCGFGRGRGGRGNRHMFHATGVPGWMRAGQSAVLEPSAGDADKQVLTSRAEALQRQLDAVKQRLAGLDKKEG